MTLGLAKKPVYQDTFNHFTQTESSITPNWLTKLRQQAMENFTKLGFPTLEHEEWKYTNISHIAKQEFERNTTGNVEVVAKLTPFCGEAENSQLVFLNGAFVSTLSKQQNLPKTVIACSLTDAFQNHGNLLQKYLSRYINSKTDAFTALNTAFTKDGALIVIPDGVQIDVPINLLFISDYIADNCASYPRVLILAGKRSKVTILENYMALDDEAGRFGNRPYFTNAVTEIAVQEGAQVEHYKLQKESLNAFHIGNTSVEIERDSTFSSYLITLGSQISRNKIAVKFNNEGGNCYLNGLYCTNNNQLADSQVVVDHAFPHCTSEVLYKGMLDGNSRGVFGGKVFVRKQAQSTNATQTNRNLLLSSSARVDTKPQLEIFADDVKCGHGATVGQIDDEETFYLLSRGISPKAARGLLTYGFAQEVVERIKINSLKTQLGRAMSMHIGEQNK